MALEIYQFRDPGEVIADVLARREVRAGDVLVALVRNPSTEQKVIKVVPVPLRRRRGLDRYNRSGLLADVVHGMSIPARPPGESPTHSTMTITARTGFAVIGPDEATWLVAWHFANHLAPVFTADLAVVTPYGWTDFMTAWGGHAPALAAAGFPQPS